MDLSINNLSFSYGSSQVLRGITHTFEAGLITGIIGPNGSGKTTLLRSINGIVLADGEIALGKRDLKKMKRKEIARHMAFVAQKEDISFPFSVYEILLMGRYPYLSPRKKITEKDYEIVDGIIALMGIDTIRDRAINAISGGEFQKAMIARALVQEPGVILLDEPTLHLDLNHQFEILNFIQKICREKNLIVVMVSHDLYLAGKYLDRCIILNRGLIHDAGKTREVLTPSSIKEIYNVDADVQINDSGGITVLPMNTVLSSDKGEKHVR